MRQKPQRPFVPHRTPNTARPAITVSEFRLSRPFVPGSERGTGESIAPPDSVGVADRRSDYSISLRPIEDFLDTSSSAAAGYAQDANDDSYATELDDEPDELPPVEHFMDTLPVAEHFAPSESGWIETDWQQYDWRAAAALGEGVDHEASSAWATTDWDGKAPRARGPRQTAANAIATALDEIAQRIRDGELAVPGRGPIADPATIAATLAALLGVRR